MGVSFRVSRTGTRYRHKPPPTSSFIAEDEEAQKDVVVGASDKNKSDLNSSVSKILGEANENKGVAEISDYDISFTLSLFPDGYSIGKLMENEPDPRTSMNIPKFLHPYDRASETLFSALECGQFPADILDDLPCKFIDGKVFCEVRDYRKCTFEGGCDVVPGHASPFVNRVCLRISLENIVKDISAIAHSGWTYGDLMEVESRILKALQPQLCLNPTPQLDRLAANPVPTELNFELRSMRRKRLQQISEVAVLPDNKIQDKRVCLDRVPESSRLGDPGSLVQHSAHGILNIQNNASGTMLPTRNNSFGSDSSLLASPLASHQAKYHIGVGSPKMMKDKWPGALSNVSIPSPGGQDMMNPFSDNGTNMVHGKRDDQDGQPYPLTNKKSRLTSTGGADGNLPHLGSQIDNLHGSDLHWKMQQQSQIARGAQYPNNGLQKFSQQVFEGGLNQEGGAMPFTIGQQGIRYNLKEEPVECEGLDKSDLTNIDSQQTRLQQRMPQQFMRSGYPQSPWNNLSQPLDNNSRKDDTLQKRKLVQSPRVSAGGLPQSPLSSKSGEFSSGSVGPPFGGVVSSGLIASQKDKSAVTSVPFVAGNPSFTSNANDAMQRKHQAQAAAKRRSNSLPKTPGISGVGSPASVGTMSVPISASSPPVGHQPLADQSLLDRFSKIEVVTMRCQLNRKKNKIDEFPIRKQNTFSSQLLMRELSDSSNGNFKDETYIMPLSKSLVGGSMNVCKTRILNFIQTERVMQGNGYQLVPKARTRMIMSEKPNDGAVAIHIGEIDDADYLAAEDYLPTLPNTHMADLLAAQFCSLLVRDGYHLEEHLQPNPVQMNHAPIGQLNASGISPAGAAAEMQQFSEGVPGQPSSDIKPSTSGNMPVNSSQSLQTPRMPPPGNAQTVQVSQAGVSSSRLQHSEQMPNLQQTQQNSSLIQQQQFQRSQMMLGANSIQHLNNMAAQNPNIHLGAHMAANKPSALQLQLLQQQHQQPQQLLQSQPPSQMQRKMMAGFGTVGGIGNIGNNMVGLGGNFSNTMGLGVRGVGGAGISAPMGNMSNMGNMNQNPMSASMAANISNAIRTGALTPQQAAVVKMRISQGRSNMLVGAAQSSIESMTGARQMNPGPTAGLSMLSSLNGGNINQMQRTTMGPPKLVPGMNVYMNQQQQQQQQAQQQQQQQIQQHQQQQQMQQQQETTSTLQAVMSPQMGSPSNIGIHNQMNQAQQQASPQQMSQRTPMSPQLSAGTMHPMNSGNPEFCPASPQVSSQTLVSGGSITNSPMELQGVNKSNSVNNA